MDDIKLRDLPPDVAEFIAKEADNAGESLDATVVRLLRRAALATPKAGKTRGRRRVSKGALERGAPFQSEGQPTERHKKRDLSDLGGGWTKDEADAFDRNLAWLRRIDPEVWR